MLRDESDNIELERLRKKESWAVNSEVGIGGTAVNPDLGRQTHGVLNRGLGWSGELGVEDRSMNADLVSKI